MFLTFEGVEGSGKTTQMKLLAEALEKQGDTVVLTREPGGTPIGDQIRQILLDANNKEMVPDCEVLLYYAARAQHIQEKIKPSLEQGKVVLCDRFVEASVAYQGYGRGISLQNLGFLGELVLDGLRPDLTILFDMPVEVGLERALKRASGLEAAQKEDRFEQEQKSFHEKVRAGYLEMAKKEPNRFVVVNADQTVQDLHAEILGIVLNKKRERGVSK
ncbi:MAG: dTMP kinase [Deltaproteobacteria bacterium]|nr:dTMP kinase [Deltaproteobacteria bacterium]